MRRGQTEMIGLVFIVLLIIIGILLYMRFSAIADDTGGEISRRAETVQQTSSFLTALKETTIPRCRVSLERVARACIEKDVLCISGDPCFELQNTFDAITEKTLKVQGLKYNLSVESTEVSSTFLCNSSDPYVDVDSAPVSEIVLTGGVGKGRIRLSICR